MKKFRVKSSLFMLLLILGCSTEEFTGKITNDEIVISIENFYQELLNSPTNIVGTNVVKRNPKKLYVHYMPWFHSKEVDGFWGQHWTMTNRNPDRFDDFGNREIASHYYPLIGPYSSADDDLQEYHLLLMKLSGIDGVIFDWYGSRNIHDFLTLKENTESFIKEIEEVGLQFAIMYEDRVAEYTLNKQMGAFKRMESGIQAVIDDLKYIESTYFISNNYLRLDGSEMLFIFGPHYLTNQEQWETVFLNANIQPKIYTLWKASDRVGKYAGGEFSWIDKNHIETLKGYYDYVREKGITAIGGVYGGFNDYYYEGGWKTTEEFDWTIPHNNIETFAETLDLIDNESVAFIQLLTWNDFGEGTMLEPTLEFGYNFLAKLQNYTGVSYTEEDLKLPYRLYLLRKKYGADKRLNKILDGVYRFIFTLDLEKAKNLLDTIEKDFSI